MCYVDGSDPPPSHLSDSSDTVPAPNPAFQRWHQQDQLILAWIFNSISPSLLVQVINCDTSHQLWQKLHQLHTSQSLARVLELKMQLQMTKKGASSCMQYLQQMTSIVDCLRSIGSDISEQDLVLYTLQGLGTDFDTFVTAISMRSGSLTMVELHSLLLSHEAHLKASLTSILASSVNLANSSDGSSMPPVSAFYAGTTCSRSSYVPPVSQSPVSDYHSRSFYSRGRGSSRGRGRGRFSGYTSDKPQCQICHKKGHTATKCYHRFDLAFFDSVPATNVSSPHPSHLTQPHHALLAEPAGTPTKSWFLDSGATTHVTNDLNNLSSSSVYTGRDQVHMGNGSGLSIFNIGSCYIGTTSKPLYLHNLLHVPDITKKLLSISQLTKDNAVIIEFTHSSCFVKDRLTHQTLLHGTMVNSLYQLDLSLLKHEALQSCSFLSNSIAFQTSTLFSSYYICLE
jgi:gag-polypeptide of LTR copia-type